MSSNLYEISGGNYLLIPSQVNWYFKETIKGKGSNVACEFLAALFQRKLYIESRLQMDLTGKYFVASNSDIEMYSRLNRTSQANAIKFLSALGLIDVSYKDIYKGENIIRTYRQIRINEDRIADVAKDAIIEFQHEDDNYTIIDDDIVYFDNKNSDTVENAPKEEFVEGLEAKKTSSDKVFEKTCDDISNSDFPENVKQALIDNWIPSIRTKYGRLGNYDIKVMYDTVKSYVDKGDEELTVEFINYVARRGWKNFNTGKNKFIRSNTYKQFKKNRTTNNSRK